MNEKIIFARTKKSLKIVSVSHVCLFCAHFISANAQCKMMSLFPFLFLRLYLLYNFQSCCSFVFINSITSVFYTCLSVYFFVVIFSLFLFQTTKSMTFSQKPDKKKLNPCFCNRDATIKRQKIQRIETKKRLPNNSKEFQIKIKCEVLFCQDFFVLLTARGKI